MTLLKWNGSQPNIKLQYCFNCKKQFTYSEVCRSWLCPDCKEPISLKIETSNGALHCKNFPIAKISPTDKIFIAPDFISEIIKNEERDDSFYLAIKEYGAKLHSKSSVITKVIGDWKP